MKVRYRILQEVTPTGDWETVGVITQWLSMPRHLQLSGIVHHAVSTGIWQQVLEQVHDRQLTLDNYQEALGAFERYYRLLPEVHEVEGETASEIRHFLREKYVYGQPVTPLVP